MINLQKIKKTLLFTLAVLAAVLHFTSCQTEYEYDGDILAAVNEDLSSVISFTIINSGTHRCLMTVILVKTYY